MDVVIPSHSVRTFGAAISSLSRIGSSDSYWEFDHVTGLAIRTFNDAKSAYSCAHFAPSFFERCTRGPIKEVAKQKRSRRKYVDGGDYDDNSDGDDDDSSAANSKSNDNADRFSCRVLFKALAPVVRPRKNLHSLRIVSTQSDDSMSEGVLHCLDFEFTMRHSNDALLTAVHRIRMAEAAGVTAVVSTEGASEIAVVPSVLARLLDPLQRTVEAALIVRNNGSQSSVSATSFHHSDTTLNNNAILQASSASLLKSETACGCDEFLDFDFVANRDLLCDAANDGAADMPEEVNQEVILVFSLREAKAMLHFCCLQQELVVNLFFHWGGRPLVMKATSSNDSFSIQLVLATLDYKLLTSMRTTSSSAAKDD